MDFGLPDPKRDPDRHQNCITWSLSHALPLQKISSKSVHKFASNPTDRQTNRQTDKQTNRQTNRQTDQTKNITSFFGGGNYESTCASFHLPYMEKFFNVCQNVSKQVDSSHAPNFTPSKPLHTATSSAATTTLAVAIGRTSGGSSPPPTLWKGDESPSLPRHTDGQVSALSCDAVSPFLTSSEAPYSPLAPTPSAPRRPDGRYLRRLHRAIQSLMSDIHPLHECPPAMSDKHTDLSLDWSARCCHSLVRKPREHRPW